MTRLVYAKLVNPVNCWHSEMFGQSSHLSHPAANSKQDPPLRKVKSVVQLRVVIVDGRQLVIGRCP